MLSYKLDFPDDKWTSGKFFIIVRFEFGTRHQWTCCEEKVSIVVSPSAIWAPPTRLLVTSRLMFPCCVSVTPGAAPTDRRTDRQTDRPHSAPRLTYSWCDARDSRRYTDCYVDRSHWPGTVICSHVYQARNSRPEMALWNSFNIKVFAANGV